MPSEIMDSQGLPSSSFFSEDVSFPERQVGFWKSDTMPDQHAGKSAVLTPLEKPVAVDSVKSLEHPQLSLMHDHKMNHSLDKHAVGAERALSRSFTLLRPVDIDPGTRASLNVQPASYSAEGCKVNTMATQHENSLFSSSLSELFSRKMSLSSTNPLYGHSVDTIASHFEEEEHFESLEEIEAQTIGNLLPNDDDLFTGVTDRVENNNHPSGGDDMEELDFFSSVGGMDLGDDGSVAQIDSEFPGGASNGQLGACNLSMAGEHPYGEHPSRTLFVRNINSNVEDSELRAVFEQYGDIRTLYTACKHRGFVMISYYDIRAAKNAMKALQNRPLRRRKLDIHYSIPKDNPSEKDFNQGTLVVSNVDSSVSNDELRQIFVVYGEIKEIRETPNRNHHKLVEFYDVRAAEAALCAMNKSDIAGKRIKLEASHPRGLKRLSQQIPTELEQDDFGPFVQQISPSINLTTGFSGTITSSGMDNGPILGAPSAIQAPFLKSALHHGISSSVPNSLSSLLRVESAGNQTGFAELSHSPGQLKFDIQGAPNFHPHSLPEYDGLNSGVHCNSPGAMAANINPRPLERIDTRQLARMSSNGNPIEFSEGVFGSAQNGSCPLTGHHYIWGNSYHHQLPGMIWPSSPSFVNGISIAHPGPRLHGPPRAPSPMLNPVLSINNQHVGSAIEPGRPGECAVELGRIVDRGLRESRAVDTESLCVLAGKLVWAIRIDLHILDNGGNLVDAANIAALASLLTFRRPECTLGGEDGQEVIVHPPEEREPLPLIVHHLPIAITFAFFGGEGKMVVDPTQSEEAVMGGRMTVTVNANGDICAIQKPGGEGVPQSAIMHCLQLASLSAESITKKIKNAVEAYNTERALRKIKRHPTSGAGNVSVAALDVTEQNKTIEQVEGSELSRHHMERLKLVPDEICSGRGNDNDGDIKPSKLGGTGRGQGNAMNFLGCPSSWDPYSKVVDPDSLKASLASRGVSTRHVKQKGSEENSPKTDPEKPAEDIKQATLATDTSGTALQTNGEKTLKDAVKPKNKRRKRASPSMKGS